MFTKRYALVVGLWLLVPTFAYAAGDVTLIEAFKQADYRDVNQLRGLFQRFARDIGDEPKNASTEELLYATDVASCLWNITPSADEQKRIAKLGMQWAKVMLEREPKSTAALYFMSLNMLMYSQSQGVLDTLFALREVKKYNEAAYAKDARFLYSSPPIGLGALYLFAPGFPVAFGDLEKAEKYLLEAAQNEPKQTTALVLLGALYAKKGDRNRSVAAFQKLRRIPAWSKPVSVFDKDMDFWWHVDQIRAIRALRAFDAGEEPKSVFELVDRATREIREPYLPKALQAELAIK